MYQLKALFNYNSCPETISHNDFTKNMPKLLKKHKAIHLRPIKDKFDDIEKLFSRNVQDCKLSNFKYIGGAATRKIIESKDNHNIIFTSNEAPSDQNIPFHHELAQTSNPPAYVAFHCKKQPDTKGETPIIDSNLVYKFLHTKFPDIEKKFAKLGVRYRRILPPKDDKTSPIGRSWKNTYDVESCDQLEKVLTNKGIEFEWLANKEILTISEILPAIYYNEETKQNIFHNSLVAAFIGWHDCRNNRYKSICYGDGSDIEWEVLDAIAFFMECNKVEWKWENGDIIWLDNRQVMHSRNNYTGERVVHASLWGRPLLEEKSPKIIGIRNNLKYPMSSFGLWKVPKDKAAQITYNAIKLGYRKLDCACDYGNEKEVGDGIKMALDDGLCKREDLHITSKLWNTFHKKEHVKLAFLRTLNDLQLEYLDLYLIHFPISLQYVDFNQKYPPEWVNMNDKMILENQDLGETWKEMENLVKSNLVKDIGVCNFNSALLRQIMNTSEIKPSAIQIELHPYLSQKNMLKLCQETYNLEVIAYSPLGAKSYLELNMSKENQDLSNHDVIKVIAEKYSKSCVQILLRWAIERNTIPICKSNSLDHMKENLDVYDFSLTLEDIESIDSLNINHRFNDPGVFCLDAFGTHCPIYD